MEEDAGMEETGLWRPGTSLEVSLDNRSRCGDVEVDGALVGSLVGFGGISVSVVCGNLLVILAVASTRRLRSVGTLLMTSLAVADLCLGLLVLPSSALFAALGERWLLGRFWCQCWLALDVWLCTASIYNLLAIAVDRCIAITSPLKYPILMTKSKGHYLVGATWGLSFVVASPNFILNWPKAVEEVVDTCSCTPLNNDAAYIVYSASASFFLPMTLILLLYSRIWIVVRRSHAAVYRGYIATSESSGLRVHRKAPPPTVSGPTTSGLGASADGKKGSASSLNTPASNSPDHQARTDAARRGTSVRLGRHSIATGQQLQHLEVTIQRPCSSPRVHIRRSSPAVSPRRTRWSFGTTGAMSPGTGRGGASGEEPWTAEERLGLGASLAPLLLATASPSMPRRTSLGARLAQTIRHSPGLRRINNRMAVEVRAAKMVTIVTGCFICCWLGFSVIYLLQHLPFTVVGLTGTGNRILVSDVEESVHWVRYKASENQLLIFADDHNRRFVTTAILLDHNTCAVADKFGNVSVMRLPKDVIDEVQEDPTGVRALWDRGLLNGASQKMETLCTTFVGETVSSLSKASLVAGGGECVVYATLGGSVGVLVPFSSREDSEFFTQLEMHLRNEFPPLAGRDHLAYRSYYFPVKSVVDGDLCEQYSLLDMAKQKAIAEDLDRQPSEVAKKLEDIRTRYAF